MGLRKVLIYAGIWSSILTGFYLGFWRPRIEGLNKQQSQIVTKQNVINQLKHDIEVYPKTITAEVLTEVEANLEHLFAKIPVEEELPVILKQIRQSSKHRGLKITEIVRNTSFEGQASSQESSISKVAYQVSVEGNARKVIQFLYELESGTRLMTAENVTLRRIDEGKHSIRANFTLNIFYSDLENVGQIRS